MIACGMITNPELQQFLKTLTPDQRAAATAPPGPVLCVAPAGSGKTTVIAALREKGYECAPDAARAIIQERIRQGLSPRPPAREFPGHR